MTILEKLFEKAEKYGISRSDIGKYIWGINFRRVYMFKNPTAKSLSTLEKAIDDLISKKKVKKELKS